MITNFWSSFASSSHNHNDIIDRQRITTNNVKMGYYISRVAQDNHPPVVILYGGL